MSCFRAPGWSNLPPRSCTTCASRSGPFPCSRSCCSGICHSTPRRRCERSSLSTVWRGSPAFWRVCKLSTVFGHNDASQSVDLGAVVRESLLNLGHAIDASDGVVTADPLPIVKGNKNDLIRVFQNLIMNAMKYRTGESVKVHLSAERQGDEWLIRVQDNGIGIAREYQQLIFLPLKRLHGREIPGVGLGLAICRKVVESFGGSIWVESEPGAGAIFCLTIPAAQGAAVPAQDPAPLELSAVPTSPGVLYAVNGH